MKTLRFGSRRSALALVQTRIVMDAVRAACPGCLLELVPIVTEGDMNMKPFPQASDPAGIKGLFTRELERALLEGEIDVAVHSLKDVPAAVDERLPLLAYSHREDPRDALVPGNGVETARIALIGCASARRRVQAICLFGEKTRVEPVRGNVETRLRKLDDGQFDALVLARAGLKRLGLEGRIFRTFSPEEFTPAPGQGVLAVQGRAEDAGAPWLDALRNPDVSDCAEAERAFSARLNGGCSAPVGAFARVSGRELTLTGFFADESRGVTARGTLAGARDDPRGLGEQLAEKLLKEMR